MADGDWTRATLDGLDGEAPPPPLLDFGSALAASPLKRLLCAAGGGRVAQVRQLLAEQAALVVEDLEGYTALHQAAAFGQADVITCLLEAGAKIDAVTPFGQTALHLAAWHGHLSSCEALVAAGCALWVVTAKGHTALDLARMRSEDCLAAITDACRLQIAALRREEAGLREQLEENDFRRCRLEALLGPGAPEARKADDRRFPPETPLEARAGQSQWLCALHAKVDDLLHRLWVPEMQPKELAPCQEAVGWPPPDPQDNELVTARRKLAEYVEEKQKLQIGRPQPKVDMKVQAYEDQQMQQLSGKTQKEWEQLYAETQDKLWDLSALATQEFPVPGSDRLRVGVVASVQFEQWDVLGPLSGVVARRAFVERRYYDGHALGMLCDPLVLPLQYRCKAREMRTEPLFLDTRGSGSVLRFLCDYRGLPFDCFEKRQGADAESDTRSVASSSSFGGRSSLASPSKKKRNAKLKRVNCRLVELMVDGWPTVVVVCTKRVTPGTELVLDRGEQWTRDVEVLEFLEQVSQAAENLATGVQLGREVPTLPP